MNETEQPEHLPEEVFVLELELKRGMVASHYEIFDSKVKISEDEEKIVLQFILNKKQEFSQYGEEFEDWEDIE